MEGIKADKSLRLIEYLQDLVRLSSKVVYDVASYHSRLWFSELIRRFREENNGEAGDGKPDGAD